MSRKSVMIALIGLSLLVVAWLLAKFWIVSPVGPSLHTDAPHEQSVSGNATDSLKHEISISDSATNGGPVIDRRSFRNNAITQLPGGALKDIFESLGAQIKMGRADIAYALSQELHDCAMLDPQLAKLQEGVQSKSISVEVASDHLSFLDPKVERCRGLTKEQLDSRFNLTKLAAENGDVNAQVAYPAVFAQLLQDNALDENWIRLYKENTMKYLTRAAASGSVDGMSTLAGTYWDGYVVPADKIKAYSYLYAASQSGLLLGAPKLLNLWSREMTSEEVRIAMDRGIKIYNQCCR